jgi:ribonucleotide reductase beta subunit family protein with ferritin-like domain
MINLLKTPETYIIEYPQAIDFAVKQEDIFWTAKEIALEKDLNDLKNNLTESELHGLTYVLKLFTEYELRVGNDYWLSVVMNHFKRPEIQRMAASFGAIELNVHAPFYHKINELLGLNTPEFLLSYKQDPNLVDRLQVIEQAAGKKITSVVDLLISLGSFSIVEGAILYSNFAFLKHFQAEGKNKAMNLVAGINFSVRDENLHSLGGAWLFTQLRNEAKLSTKSAQVVHGAVVDFATNIYSHEVEIIKNIFSKGKIPGITATQLEAFVRSRINLCLKQLGYDPVFEVNYDPISKWFYKNIQSAQMHDFFQKQGNAYSRDWKESNFTWV